MKNLLVPLLCLASALAGVPVACAQPAKAMRQVVVVKVAQPPVLDGKLDDAAWARAKETGGFVLLRSANGPQAPTYIRTLACGDSLYVAFRCVEPKMDRLQAVPRAKNTSVWLDDSIEVILDPDNGRKSIYHLIINAEGCQYGALCKIMPYGGVEEETGWDAKWEVKTARGSGEWTVEIRLPFASFGIDAKANPCLGINFCRERVGAKSEASTWSPARVMFADPSCLGEMVLPNEKGEYCSLEMPKLDKVLLDANPVSFSVANQTGKQIKPRLRYELNGPATFSGEVEMAAMGAGQKAHGQLPVHVEQPGDYRMVLKLEDAATGACLYVRNQNVEVPPALAVDWTPYLVYQKKIEAKVTPGVSPEKLAGASLKVSLRKDGSEADIETRTLKCEAVAATSFNLLGRESGNYRLHAEIVKGGKAVASSDSRVLGYSSRPKVGINSDGFLSVKGKPFFPVGIYTLQDRDNKDHNAILKEAHEAGFNTTVYYSTDPSFLMPLLDDCERNDIKALVYPTTAFNQRLGSETEATIIRDVNIRKDHPALLGWYLVDEPEGIGKATPAMVGELYRLIKATDPEHPCTLVIMGAQAAADFGGAADIVWIDPYPVPDKPVTYVSDCTSGAVNAVPKDKPVWVIPQAFDWSVWREGKIDKEPRPTDSEERCMTYLALVHGAKGIIYWAHTASKYYIRDYPEHWAYMKKLAGEMRDLTPVLLTQTKEAGLVINPKTASIDTMVKELDGQLYVFAVNHEAEPCKASFALPGVKSGGVADVLFEGRSVQAKGNVWQDEFAPLEVHVYRIPTK